MGNIDTDIIYSKVCTMSVHTFDIDIFPELLDLFLDNHPSRIFTSYSIKKTDIAGIFEVYLPLKINNPDFLHAVTEKELYSWLSIIKHFTI